MSDISQETTDPFAFDLAEGERTLTISDAAVRRIGELIAEEGDEGLMLRVKVSGGGCSGFQYGFSFDDDVTPDDLVFERDGVKVVTDEASIALISGGEIDFKEELIGSYFAINNPNATSSCGCGTSFAV